MEQNRVCVWLSRHEPTEEQVAALDGYNIIQVDQEFPTGKAAWEAVKDWHPAIIMAILPIPMLGELVRLATPVPIVRAVMDWRGNPEHPWTGRWEVVREVVVHCEPFDPAEYQPDDSGSV